MIQNLVFIPTRLPLKFYNATSETGSVSEDIFINIFLTKESKKKLSVKDREDSAEIRSDQIRSDQIRLSD